MYALLFHTAVFTVYSVTLWYDQNYVDFPFKEDVKKHNLPFKNRILFLTMWSLALQTIYFAISILNDLFGSNAANLKKRPVLRVIKDTLFTLAFPIALYVSIAFWAIYLVNKDLIFPEELAKVLPVWANQVMHTFITPFIAIEILISHIQYPSRKVGVSMAILFTLSYLTVMFLCYSKTGIWIYPFLAVFNWPVRILFFSVSILFGVSLYIFGEKVNSLVNKNNKKQIKGTKHKNQ